MPSKEEKQMPCGIQKFLHIIKNQIVVQYFNATKSQLSTLKN